MSKPKPIKVRGPGGLQIKVVGYRSGSDPYLYVEKGSEAYGFIEDRDIKRLHAWCADCLKRRPRRSAT